MSWYEITVLFLTGLFAGFVNTLAGGGSIVSFSILLMFGLPPSIAKTTLNPEWTKALHIEKTCKRVVLILPFCIDAKGIL